MNTPSPYEPGLRAYATRLAEILRETLGIVLPENFVENFCWNARRVGVSNYEDLGSWLVLECLEEKHRDGKVTSEAVARAIDRVRHRIVRRAGRELRAFGYAGDKVPDLKELAICEHNNIEVRDFANHLVRTLSEHLSPLQLLLFEGYYLDGDHVDVLSSELGISRATAYRQLSKIKYIIKSNYNSPI